MPSTVRREVPDLPNGGVRPASLGRRSGLLTLGQRPDLGSAGEGGKQTRAKRGRVGTASWCALGEQDRWAYETNRCLTPR